MVQLTTLDVGLAGEQLVIAELVKRGVEVYTAAGLYDIDLLIVVNRRRYSVQVKATKASGANAFRFRRAKNRKYADGEIDFYALVSLPTGQIVMIQAPDRASAYVNFDKLRPEMELGAVIDRLKKGDDSFD